jgi:hypothetical protein
VHCPARVLGVIFESSKAKNKNYPTKKCSCLLELRLTPATKSSCKKQELQALPCAVSLSLFSSYDNESLLTTTYSLTIFYHLHFSESPKLETNVCYNQNHTTHPSDYTLFVYTKCLRNSNKQPNHYQQSRRFPNPGVHLS